ncbi:hypothetical protein E4U31_002827 [Claviceps sp. LM219 group G6]|nr:hypothetical protein E4U31_002827 [Claviceps sp. LM219 group G6]
MDHKVWIDAIQQNPTAGYLTEFRKFAEDKGVRHSDDLDKLIGDVGLENHPAGKALRVSQASWLEKAIKTPLPSFQPLLSRAIDQVDDGDLWREVKKVVQLETEGTPPPPPTVTALLRKGVIGTPFKPNSGSFVNAKELVGDVRPTLMGELGPLHVDVPNLLDTFVPKSGDLKKKAARFFDVCCKLDQSPRYKDGVWKEWPTSAVEVYVAGELKCNPRADVPSIAWRDITKYARETFAAQSNRRFVLAFTICGTMMRVWVFDRVSGNASEKIDINKEPLRFIEIMLGFEDQRRIWIIFGKR